MDGIFSVDSLGDLLDNEEVVVENKDAVVLIGTVVVVTVVNAAMKVCLIDCGDDDFLIDGLETCEAQCSRTLSAGAGNKELAQLSPKGHTQDAGGNLVLKEETHFFQPFRH
ncbi:hypothetical protein NDU88_001132 [Pleurodeles waltl]|uniref:Uncharacterized protein n=1 Tax=Pleurodeles waltl TaxID=8319 RepID=A0AAV7S900_PLEWA|nr:hypothetical protein NDU88_001132 [Pleurodeles waltl]